VQRQLGEQNRWNALRRSSTYVSRSLIALHEMRSQSEVAYDGFGGILDEQICACALSGGALRVLLQPDVEGVVPALEFAQDVSGGKRLDSVARAGLIRLRRFALVAARASLGAFSGWSRDPTNWSK
jgi:hypothetical protein